MILVDMKFFQFFLLMCSLVLVSCGDDAQAPPPEPLDRDVLVSSLSDHFNDHGILTPVKLDSIISHIGTKNYVNAYRELNEIAMSPDLKEDSRLLIARASLTLSDMIDEAAASGDKKAKMHQRQHILMK